MANEPFGEVWLTVDEVVALGRSARRVQMNISRGIWKSKPRPAATRGRPSSLVALSSLPEDLRQRWRASQAVVGANGDDPHGLDNTDAEPSVMPAAPTTTDDRLTEALMRYPFEVREALLEEARRLNSIVQRYLALPSKRQRVANLEVVGSSPTGRARASKHGSERANVAEMADAPDTGREAEKALAASSAGYEFSPAVFELCKEAACTNPVIIDYYKSRQHTIRKGTEPRCAKPISPVTLDNWSRRVRKEGLLTFLPAPPKATESYDDKRTAKLPREAIEWLNRNYRLKPHARALYQDYKKAARRHGWPGVPSQGWFYRKWKSLPAIIADTLRSKKTYVDKHAPYYPRDVRDLEPLQILCGDHSERDVTVRLPNGSLARPWLTTWQDVLTGLIWGWHLDLTPSSRTIGLAYANGVKNFGAQPIARPDQGFFSYLYTDQGKDYRSHAIGGKTLTFKRAAAIEGGLAFLCDQRGTQPLDDEQNEKHVGLIHELGLKHFLARGYNAREKGVERYHRDLSGWESKTFAVEYCGSDAKNKPDAWREAYAQHERYLAKAKKTGNMPWLEESPFMTLDEYYDALVGQIHEYNSTTHQRSTLGGVTVVPIEEYRRLYTTKYEISEQALAMILLKAEKRVVLKNGVRINGLEYLHPQLAYYKSNKRNRIEVEVRYSDDDFRRVWIIPPPIPAIPHPVPFEAEAVIRGGILNPNRETQKMKARQEKFERTLRRDHAFLSQSTMRGESVEDRVAAAMLEPEAEEVVEAIAAVGGSSRGAAISSASSEIHASVRTPGDGADGLGGPVSHRATVHLLTGYDRRGRMDRSKVRPVTVDEVAHIAVDESIFADDEDASGTSAVLKMWEDEE